MEPLQTAADLSSEWLLEVLGREAETWSIEPIGTGQMSQNYRLGLPGGEAVVLKLASEDANSRATGVGLGAYEREVRFYRDIAPTLGAGAPLAGCRHAAIDPAAGWFSIVLEDLAPALQGDQLRGCTLVQAAHAVDALVELQAARWDDERLRATPWLTGPSPLNQALLGALMPGFIERYGERVSAEHLDLCERFVGCLDAWLVEQPRPHALIHGDYRLDNMLFAPDGKVTVVDWQTCSFGPALLDMSYFLGGSLTVADRRAGERDLLERYHRGLLAHGVGDLDWEDCWREYRRGAFANIAMAIAASMLVERTERGDEMFMTVLARSAQQALDLDSLSLIDAHAVAAPLSVDRADEAPHAPGLEQLWNESWYFDFTTTAEGPAGYTRIGLYPNLGVAWFTLALVRAGAPTVEIVDLAVPLPGGAEPLFVGTDAFSAEHRCSEALQSFAVRVSGTGESYRDPAAVLRGERGEPTEVAIDLRWETAGEPYAYRMTTRYEIPCTVSGTITIAGESIAIEGLGQRDHSWGTRDWWAMDWCWSAGALEDGTRFHATELRLPNLPRLGIGYLQDTEGLHELEHVAVTETLASSGLVAGATIAMGPPELALEVRALADGPLLLRAADGRVAHFPRSLCSLRAADGRNGLAWVEWNINQA